MAVEHVHVLNGNRQITWQIIHGTLLIVFCPDDADIVRMELPNGCRIYNDNLTGKTQALTVPVHNHGTNNLDVTFDYDYEVHALSIFIEKNLHSSWNNVKTSASEDLRFIMDTLDEKIVHLEVPDVLSTLKLAEIAV